MKTERRRRKEKNIRYVVSELLLVVLTGGKRNLSGIELVRRRLCLKRITNIKMHEEALMNTSSRRVFLDLAVGGTFLARIIIRVKDEGNLALNFLHVCEGDLGPSYANSQLSSVENEGQPGEYIFVKGHEKSVIEIDWDKERQREIYKSTPFKAGEVRGYLYDFSASEFYIVTRDHPSWRYNNCFGIVEEGGLDVLREAVWRYQDITAVEIVDCGLMFSV